MRFFISGCSPDHDSARITSSAVIMPRSPWLASAACTKNAGVPVEASVAAILRATWPDLPTPVTISRPLALRMRSGPATGRCGRALRLRALWPCLALIAFSAPAHAQTVTADLLRPVRDGFVLPQDSPLRRTGDPAGDSAAAAQLRDRDTPAPSRIGQIPRYGVAAANGASDSGFDSLNRRRKKP